VLSAIAFALAHEEIMWQLFAMHMIFGLFAADLYRRTGHLGAPMALHMTNNLISYML
jgi:membrane protease YdiL (CAAX protease family)